MKLHTGAYFNIACATCETSIANITLLLQSSSLLFNYSPWPEASGGATSCRVDVSAVWTDVSAVWGVCADSVGAVANSQLPCVLGCLTQLLPRVSTRGSLGGGGGHLPLPVCPVQVELGVVPDTVQSCWSAVSVCLAALPFFLRLLLHPHLLLSPDSAAVEVVDEVRLLCSLQL